MSTHVMPVLAAEERLMGYLLLGGVAIFLIFVMLSIVRDMLYPRKLGPILKQFFGGLAGVAAHDKPFPSYDLVSVNRALDEFLRRACDGVKIVGGIPLNAGTLSDALDGFLSSHKVASVKYKRVQVDVDEEASMRSGCIWTATLRQTQAPAEDGRIAISISMQGISRPTNDFSGGEQGQSTIIQVSVASRSREVAARVFTEIEQLRRKLNVYRGKVVAPEVDGSGIHALAFAKLRLVAENELVLPESTKRLIDGSVLAFYRNREKLRQAGVEMKRGILLCSPPGTGKTSVALYLAGMLTDFTVCFVSGRQLLYPRDICQMARYLRPTMLVFEDIDLIAQDRDRNGLATILGELMNQIDGCLPDEEVLFVMNTNSLERLEQAVRDRPGRVDQIIELPLPDEAARRRLVKLFGANLEIASTGIQRFASESDGITPAMVKEVVKRAAVLAVQREKPDESNNAEKLKITETDLMLAFEQVRWSRIP